MFELQIKRINRLIKRSFEVIFKKNCSITYFFKARLKINE